MPREDPGLIPRFRVPLNSEGLLCQSLKTRRGGHFFQRPNFQQDIEKHTKKQENVAHSKEQNKSPVIIPKEHMHQTYYTNILKELS